LNQAIQNTSQIPHLAELVVLGGSRGDVVVGHGALFALALARRAHSVDEVVGVGLKKKHTIANRATAAGQLNMVWRPPKTRFTAHVN